MSDRVLMVWAAIGGLTAQILGLLVLVRMLRESQRLTREVASLVDEKNERTRAALGRP